MHHLETAQHYLDDAIGAIGTGGERGRHVLDALPVPVYTVDADGKVTYWNRACVEFAGREPELDKDQWCVTWRLYKTSGESLPHDQCPMAVAVHEKRSVRNEIAIAERPDGSRRAFMPYPTPLFDKSGQLTGAVNLLLDVSEEQEGALSRQASRCRRLAAAIGDRETADMLTGMAEGLEANAIAIRTER